jgi:pimeloyl-ACP methyl ester carboxylesterase
MTASGMGHVALASQHYTGGSLQNPTGATLRLADVPEDVDILPVQLTAEDGAPSKGLLYRLRGVRPRVGVHLMHPRTDQSTNYNIVPLVRAGCAVLGRAGRWPNNDVATIHELLLLDFAAGVRFLRESGCDRIVLLGNSGGSSLAAFYQAQALASPDGRLRETPAGDALDLNRFDLPCADGIVFIGGHIGQGLVLGKLIDPAVVDEDDPLATDPELDLFNPANGFVTPPKSSRFTADFLTRYRRAQSDRMRRLDNKARSLLQRQTEAAEALNLLGSRASLEQIRAAKVERHMIIYRTTADPAFVDLNIDPDDRPVCSYFSGRPDLENYGADGFARYITPRAWLSTWSALSSNARTADNLARITTPLLVVHYAGDTGTRMSEAREFHARAASTEKSLHIVRDAEHYGFRLNPDGSKGPRTTEGTDAVVNWVKRHFPL